MTATSSPRRLQISVVCVLVLVLGTTFSVARAARQPTAPYQDRCTIAAPDTDRDRIPDCWERKNGLDPSHADARSDLDRDGLSAIEEFVLDMRADARPLFPYRASVRDSDGDGVSDGNEDADSDGYANVWEFRHGSDPLDRKDPIQPTKPPTPGPTKPPTPAPSPSPTTPPSPSPTTPPSPSPTTPPSPSPTTPPPPPSPTPPVSPPTPPPGGCYGVPASIDSSGSTNVTAQLQAFIDSVPDGACIRLASGARYRADDTIWLRNRHDLTILATGATLFTDTLDPIILSGKGAGGSDRRQLAIELGSNITIDGLTIDGPNPVANYDQTRESEAGIVVKGTQGAVLRNLTIQEVFGDFVTISDGTEVPGLQIHVPARNVVVTGGHFRVAGRQGIGIIGDSIGTTIDGNTFDGTGRSGIDIELIPGRAASNIRITNNTFHDFGLNWVAMGGHSSVQGAYIGFNHVVGATLRLKAGPPAGVTTVVHQDLTFEGNTSDVEAAGDAPIFSFRYVMHVVIVGNVQHFAPNTAGIAVIADGGCDFRVANNDFAGMTTLFLQAPPPACPV